MSTDKDSKINIQEFTHDTDKSQDKATRSVLILGSQQNYLIRKKLNLSKLVRSMLANLMSENPLKEDEK